MFSAYILQDDTEKQFHAPSVVAVVLPESEENQMRLNGAKLQKPYSSGEGMAIFISYPVRKIVESQNPEGLAQFREFLQYIQTIRYTERGTICLIS